MRIEGHFTVEEIRSAVALGATTAKLPYKKIRLSFPTQVAYDTWFSQQKKDRPDLWGTMMVLTPKAPISRP